MAKIITIYWRDIPSAVLVQERRERAKVQLSHRFQAAIDRAAMRAGKGSSDAYIAEWRRETTPCGKVESLQAVADQEAKRLEMAYSDEQLKVLIRQHGAASSE